MAPWRRCTSVTSPETNSRWKKAYWRRRASRESVSWYVMPVRDVLAGASLGGLFTLYAMYSQPDLFSAWVAVTPAVAVNDSWLLGYEEEFAQAGGQLEGRLFVSMGENESPRFIAPILHYNSRVASRGYRELAYLFRIVDGERHAGMQLESYTRGLRFVLAPLAPEQGPVTSP